MSNPEASVIGTGSRVTSIAMARSYNTQSFDGIGPPLHSRDEAPSAPNRTQTLSNRIGEALLKAAALPFIAAYRFSDVPDEEMYFER